MSITNENFKLGTKVYYTGDMANFDGIGTIVKVRPATKYGSEAVDIRFDEPRPEGGSQTIRGITLISFEPSPGRRFYLLDEWIEERKQAIEKMRLDFIKVMSANAATSEKA